MPFARHIPGVSSGTEKGSFAGSAGRIVFRKNGVRGNSLRVVVSCLSKIPDGWSELFCKTTSEGSISSALKETQPRCGCHCVGLARRRGGFEVHRGAIP